MLRCHVRCIAACTDTEPTAEDSDSTNADTGKSSEDNQQKSSLETRLEGQSMGAEAICEPHHLAAAKKAIEARELKLNSLTSEQGVLESLRRAGVSAALVAEVADKTSKMRPR